MAEIRPFKGTHYSKSKVQDWGPVICPPHDVISPQLQDELYQRDEYNFVRLEYSKTQPDDSNSNNRYTRSASTLEQWLKKGILETDKSPTIYLHDHMFTLDGREYKRRSLIVRVKLEEWESRIIRPHEQTFDRTRSDRLSLLRALQANTSPILAMYEDRQQQIAGLIVRQTQRFPIMAARIVNGEGHNVWSITDSSTLNTIVKNLAEQPVYIADGHHRYESALAYRNEKKASNKSADAPFNFVMMELVDFSQLGLKILAPHRLVRGISQLTLDGMLPKLEEFFAVEQTPLDAGNVRKQVEDFFAATEGVRFALSGQPAGSLLKLKLRDQASASRMIPGSHSDLYKNLDVSIVDHILLEKTLGMPEGENKTGLSYNHDFADVVDRVTGGQDQLAVLLDPVKPSTLKAIADAGDKMPPKSTYFYPKAPSGLVLNRLV